MEKINIAELLKNCPKGIRLDSPMFNNVVFDGIGDNKVYPITILVGDEKQYELSKYGEWIYNDAYAKCVIFPKGKTTWEGFVPPYKFKNGDIIVDKNDNIAIYKQIHELYDEYYVDFYCGIIKCNNNFVIKNNKYENWGKIKDIRLATEEEKEILFKAIEYNGYKWNTKTKTLGKLIKLKFKIGDKVKEIKGNRKGTIINIYGNSFYEINRTEGFSHVNIADQDEWELVPDKFDINTLQPYISKVLVRDDEDSIWQPCVWGLYDNGHRFPYVTTGNRYRYCIPYKGNDHLIGTTDDCVEYYKTWEE